MAAIEDRIRKCGRKGTITLVITEGRVSVIETKTTEQWAAGEAA
jgi:hypothetical protein